MPVPVLPQKTQYSFWRVRWLHAERKGLRCNHQLPDWSRLPYHFRILGGDEYNRYLSGLLIFLCAGHWTIFLPSSRPAATVVPIFIFNASSAELAVSTFIPFILKLNFRISQRSLHRLQQNTLIVHCFLINMRYSKQILLPQSYTLFLSATKVRCLLREKWNTCYNWLLCMLKVIRSILSPYQLRVRSVETRAGSVLTPYWVRIRFKRAGTRWYEPDAELVRLWHGFGKVKNCKLITLHSSFSVFILTFVLI